MADDEASAVTGPPHFSISEAYKSAYPGLAFGLALISGCQNPVNPPGFDEYKRKHLRGMRKRETLARISDRIEAYGRFFSTFGYYLFYVFVVNQLILLLKFSQELPDYFSQIFFKITISFPLILIL